MKNKTIFFSKWLSTGYLHTHLAKSLIAMGVYLFWGPMQSWRHTCVLEFKEKDVIYTNLMDILTS